jgi:membrane-associated protease RseP (regulator of RpoE activity)
MPFSKIRNVFRKYLFRLNNGIPYSYNTDHENHYFIPVTDTLPYKPKWKLNLFLFIITLCTTTLFAPSSGETVVEALINGLPYSLTLMTILSIHEFGHYFAARKFGVSATLPYFIPFPSIIGTMGAVIKTKSPIPHRRALFYIGIMGPLPGFFASLIAVCIGVAMSEIVPIPLTEEIIIQLGNSMLFSLIVYIFHGNIPGGYDLFLHPVAWAGWIGFFITSLNLMPIGQLDGGHVLYSLIGRKQTYAGWVALVSLVVLTFIWPGWGLWVIITLLILMVAHPPIREATPLTLKEKIAGWFCMAVFILTFIPVPVQLL